MARYLKEYLDSILPFARPEPSETVRELLWVMLKSESCSAGVSPNTWEVIGKFAAPERLVVINGFVDGIAVAIGEYILGSAAANAVHCFVYG
jgi:hypothetical protein